MMSNASGLRGLHGDLHHENIMFSSRGWLVIDPVGLSVKWALAPANMFYDPADRDDLCLDLDALHRWRTHSLVRWTSIRVACSTRRTLMGAFPQLGTRMEKRARDLSYRGRDQAGATDVILDIKGPCCKVSDEAAFCLIQRPYISKTLLTRRISPRGSP